MTDSITVDLCVIGAGAAGLSVAAGASQMGAKTLLIERGVMGGDCLNFGCVPSKCLLVAGKAAQVYRRAADLGIRYQPPEIDFQAVHDHVHGVIETISAVDSVERFEGLGVQVVKAEARFVGPQEVEAGGQRILAKRFVLATGSAPLVPPIPGLDQVEFHTNETIFSLTTCPDHLVVLGGGPIGCELGQAFRHLGARVTIVEMQSILPKDDPETVDVVRQSLRRDGIDLLEATTVTSVAPRDGGLSVQVEHDGETRSIEASHLLLAAGRRPVLEGLGLDQAGVEHHRGGITVDDRLRTSNKRIYAAGDAVGGYQFTHIASYHAGVIIKNALFRLPSKVNYDALPWVTYTSPELAHVGVSEAEARKRGESLRVLRWPYAENDRAQTEHLTNGFIKVITRTNGRILGATIVGAQAGELIQPWVLALSKGLKIGAMAQMIAPYPTLGEVGKRAAGSFYVAKLFSDRTRKIVRFLLRFG